MKEERQTVIIVAGSIDCGMSKLFANQNVEVITTAEASARGISLHEIPEPIKIKAPVDLGLTYCFEPPLARRERRAKERKKK